MDFFAHQDAARRRSTLLVVLYILSVLFIIAGIYFAIVSGIVLSFDSRTLHHLCYLNRNSHYCSPWWQPDIFFTTFIGVTVVIGATSLYKTWRLRRGGAVLAESLGGHRIIWEHSSPAEKRLLNIVEEMAIASGCPVPPVYVLPNEDEINAFCAGYNPSNTVFAVTNGALNYLSREELQGVIGHEFSHMLHGDCKLNIRLIGVLHGIIALSLLGRFIMRSSFWSRRRSRDDNGFAFLLLGIILFAIGSIGILFARLIKSAVSRQREFLADASAVQYTRNPNGIASALQKVHEVGSRVQHPSAEEASHMFFSNGLRASWIGLFATHPPLQRRIERITTIPSSSEDSVTAPNVQTTTYEGLSGFTAIRPQEVAAAQALIQQIPPLVYESAHNPGAVPELLLALVAARSPETQYKLLKENKLKTKEFVDLLNLYQNIQTELYLPIVELAAPALTILPEAEIAQLRKDLIDVIQADKVTTIFEFCIVILVEKYSDPNWPKRSHFLTTPDAARALLSVFAMFCQKDPNQSLAAYNAGAAHYELSQSPLARSECSYDHLAHAIYYFASRSHQEQQKLLQALRPVITADGIVSSQESDLYRTICMTFDIPAPLHLEMT